MAEQGGRQVRDVPEEWPVLDSATRFTGRVTSMRSDLVRMSDGSTAWRDYTEHPGAVSVVPMDERGRVLLVRQYRHPVRARLWEVPAGILDKPGENPLHAAQRELAEETHHTAGVWRVLADLYLSPGATSEAMRIFLATEVAEATGERFVPEHEEVDMSLAWVDRRELVRSVLAGELQNPALVAGVLALDAALRADGGLDALRPAAAPWPARPFAD